jgi:hypothetical protein
MRNNILFEEISRIHEIMGVKSKNLLIEAANIQNYMFEFVDDFLKSLGVKSEQEIDETYRLIDEFERLTSQKEKEAFTRRLNEEQKKLMDGVNRLKKGTGVEKQDLIDMLKASSNKDQSYATKIDQFSDLIFQSPGLKDIAIASFKNVNKEAKSWDIYLKKRLEEFTSTRQIDDWATSKIETINNSDIPQYVKDYYIDLITKNSEQLKNSLRSWIKFRTSDEYVKIINSLPKNSVSSFDKMSKNIYEKRMSDNTLDGLMGELEQISKIYQSGVQNWTTEETKKVIDIILKSLNDGESIQNAANKYKKELDQSLHQNPTAFSRLCRDTWINKPDTEKANLLINALGAMFSSTQAKQFPMKYKLGKCGLVPFVILTLGITAIFGTSLWSQLEKVYEIPGIGPIIAEYAGVFPAKKQKEIVDSLFPNLRFLTYTDLINRESFYKLINKTDTADESEKEKEPILGVVKISLNKDDYTVICTDTSSRESKNDPNNWVVITKDGTLQQMFSLDGKYNSQNEFTNYAIEQSKNDNSDISKKLPNFSIEEYYVFSEEPNVVKSYLHSTPSIIFEFVKQEDGSWISTIPTIEKFLEWIISDSGTAEEWGPSKESLIGLENENKRYKVKNVSDQYIIVDTQDLKYKEFYTYDKEKKSFKFIKFEQQ